MKRNKDLTEENNNPEESDETQKSESSREDKDKLPEEKVKKEISPMRYPQLFLLHAIVIVIILWLMFGWVFGIMSAPSNDMYPRIDSGDMLLYYRLDRDVMASDVIVLRKNDTVYVARVVAVGGDTVEITDKETLVVNGNTVIENNITEKTPIYEGFVEYPLTLKSGECFVLVDHRNGGEDSRYFGPVSKDEIIGTVITVVRRTNL